MLRRTIRARPASRTASIDVRLRLEHLVRRGSWRRLAREPDQARGERGSRGRRARGRVAAARRAGRSSSGPGATTAEPMSSGRQVRTSTAGCGPRWRAGAGSAPRRARARRGSARRPGWASPCSLELGGALEQLVPRSRSDSRAVRRSTSPSSAAESIEPDAEQALGALDELGAGRRGSGRSGDSRPSAAPGHAPAARSAEPAVQPAVRSHAPRRDSRRGRGRRRARRRPASA